MPEVSGKEAGQIIGISHDTILRCVNKGLLTARREGVRREIRIDMGELRRFAEEYQYRFNEDLARQLTAN